ncbi:helix-turn-helix domain-containing protein [Bacteroidota bacterium]
MEKLEITEMAALAARFVNSTNRHVFLTGKAGTGKTTFLRQLSQSTHKSHVILAPTGIAALNANGTTIHSQFLLPMGTFLPDRNLPDELPDGANFYTQRSLVRRHPLNAKRRDVLRNIDLLIIDEVSMLRADLLDAIDARLRNVKRNYSQPFGGVQLLMIGDMYQLPPIVKDQEWNKMSQYYRSPHFFESVGLRQSGFVYIELDKIFRQQDDAFISILNNLRNNVVTKEDIEELNAHYQEGGSIPKDTITITTHNYKADEINRQELDKLVVDNHFFEAQVEDDFPDNLFPVRESLELKEGAQIMFVKNDSADGAYFNGKLAKIKSIKDEVIEVLMADTNEPYVLKRETWENKKYALNETTKDLEEEVVGRFSQYPIKLAWAITVHKSQGLTFERAVIDVGRAFAPGQVYVALSRLTSLKGLILRTKIDPSVVSTDNQVVAFGKVKEAQDPLSNILQQEQAIYLEALMVETFDVSEIQRLISQIEQKHDSAGEFEDPEMQSALSVLAKSVARELANTEKFKQQIRYCLHHREYTKLLDRIEKGSAYYIEFIKKNLFILVKHLEEVKQFSRTKTYQTALTEIDLLFMKKWEQMDKAKHVAQCIVEGKEVTPQPEKDKERLAKRKALVGEISSVVQENPKNTKTKTGKTRKKKAPGAPKAEKGATYKITYELAKNGLSISEIAEKRELVTTTIEGHIARGIQEKVLTIDKFMDEDDRETIEQVLNDNPEGNSGLIYAKLNGQYTYAQIRMVQAHLGRMSK